MISNKGQFSLIGTKTSTGHIIVAFPLKKGQWRNHLVITNVTLRNNTGQTIPKNSIGVILRRRVDNTVDVQHRCEHCGNYSEVRNVPIIDLSCVRADNS